MRNTAIVLAGTLLALIAQTALATPDRESLLAAWETNIRNLPGTVSFEKIGNDTYRLEDKDLPYDGELRILGALVRSSETPGLDMEFTHLGMVEFELGNLPEERLTSQVYYYWLADRQTMHYSTESQGWVNTSVYRDSFTDWYGDSPSFGALTFFINYGVWIVLIGILLFAFLAIRKQEKKARSLMDDTAEINQMARENIERSEAMHDEVLSISRQSLELHASTNELLQEIRDSLKR